MAKPIKVDYAGSFAVTQTATIQQRATLSIFAAASQIINEPLTTLPRVDGKRHELARKVLQEWNDNLLARFINVMVGTGNLQATALDSDIDTAVAAAWNQIAGISAFDQAALVVPGQSPI